MPPLCVSVTSINEYLDNHVAFGVLRSAGKFECSWNVSQAAYSVCNELGDVGDRLSCAMLLRRVLQQVDAASVCVVVAKDAEQINFS